MVPEGIKPIVQARREKFAGRMLHPRSQVEETLTIDTSTSEHKTKLHLKYDGNVSGCIRRRGQGKEEESVQKYVFFS